MKDVGSCYHIKRNYYEYSLIGIVKAKCTRRNEILELEDPHINVRKTQERTSTFKKKYTNRSNANI